jgi:hypothetical protein
MIDKQQLSDDRISKILNDSKRVTQIIQSGINDALLKHKKMGNPICEWRNNRVVWIPADKIVIPQEK